jgi:hypothetical protein
LSSDSTIASLRAISDAAGVVVTYTGLGTALAAFISWLLGDSKEDVASYGAVGMAITLPAALEVGGYLLLK